VLAVLREALTNVARHADATSVEVFLEIGDDVRLAVRDNGRGLPGAYGRRGGTRTMRERAALLGGRCSIRTRPTGGTSVVWTVPARVTVVH
jgi:signal transduction histidine kinase